MANKLLDFLFIVFTGETLQDERINGGAFIGADGVQFPHKLIPVSFGLLFTVLMCCISFSLQRTG